MQCPKCQNSEFDSEGVCLACGFQVEIQAAREDSIPEARTQAEYPPDEAEVPEWRRELTRRLQKIKEKKDVDIPVPVAAPPDKPVMEIKSQTAPPLHERQPRKPPRPKMTAAPEEPTRRSAAAYHAGAAPKQASAPQPAAPRKPAHSADPGKPKPAKPRRAVSASGPDPLAIQSLIDSIVASKSQRVATQHADPDPVATSPQVSLPPRTDKLILLSRTLSGLVDLLVVLICGYLCIAAADIFSGIVLVDARSLVNYALLMILVHFVYSCFFLGTVNQTIGMMMTDLRLVGENSRRPGFGHILLRSALFLPSLLLAGLGLVPALIDKESACLHDRYSGTHITRIPIM